MTVDDVRTVHAVGGGVEVVRYERAKIWVVEHGPSHGIPMRRVTVQEAANEAAKILVKGGKIRFGTPGGTKFDELCRRFVK